MEKNILNNPSAIEFRRDHSDVDWKELETLFSLVDFGGRKGEKLRRAFLNSQAVCYAYESQRLVSAARAISDGEYHAVIYDVAVHPDYQGKGVGGLVMLELLEQLPVWRVMLAASGDVQPFYKKLGFSSYPDVLARLNWDNLYDNPNAVDQSGG